MNIDLKVPTAIETRRSVREFDPGHGLADAEVERLLTLASRAPSAFNLQHWRFVVVRDRALRAELRASAWNQAQVTDASLLVAIVADLSAWRDPAPMWGHVDDATRATILGMIDGFYRGREAFQRDEAMRSVGLVAQTMMLAATGMGLDSCPMDGFDADAVARLLRVPDHCVVGMMVAVGREKADARPALRTHRLPLADTVVIDRFA